MQATPKRQKPELPSGQGKEYRNARFTFGKKEVFSSLLNI